MQQPMDVSSLLRQMQMNMMMPSLLLSQQQPMMGLPSTGMSGTMNGDVIRSSLGQPVLTGPNMQPAPIMQSTEPAGSS